MTGEQSVTVLGTIIDRNRSEIVRRWLERVLRDIAGAPDVGVLQLRDGLPYYLVALVRLLRAGKSATETHSDAMTAWADVAREHGITRVRIGFNITELVHEFVVLRHVLREVVAEEQPGSLYWEPVLTDLLDAGIVVAVRAYVEARDFEVRRRQAEHIGFLIHELRTPLSTAMGAAEQLRAVPPAQQARFFDMLDRNHQRLEGLIDGVLLTERLEAGKVAPRRVHLRLGDLMDEALEGARTAAAAKGLAFRVSYEPELVLELDRDLTRSALQNVADNAVRYTDAGAVDVTVEHAEGAVVFHVRDTCHGLSSEELRTIFEPFERGSTRKSGTGLGLAIARRAVEAQDGAIGADSPGAVGCHFWIRLPA